MCCVKLNLIYIIQPNKIIIQKYSTFVNKLVQIFLKISTKGVVMRYLELIKDLQNLTNEKLTDRRMMIAFDLRTPSAITYKKTNNSTVTDDEIEKVERSFNVNLSSNGVPHITLDYYPDIEVSCGNGIIPFGETKEKMTIPVSLIKGYSKNKKYVIVSATSDSMQPEIKPNDMLIIRVTDTDTIIDNHIYVFCYNERLYCKYLSYNVNQIIVRSANKDYPTRFIEKENINDFKLCGEVCGHFRSYLR